MSRKYSQEAPEDFREALSTGQVGRYLKNWLAIIAVLVVAWLIYWGYTRVSAAIHGPSLTSATAHAQQMWAAGDQTGAIAYYRPVADKGDKRAAYVLGVMYATARGRAHDGAKAAAWLKKAAEMGSPAADRALAVLYRNGDGVAKDDAAVLRHLRAAANGGDADAEADLAQDYEDGDIGLPKDLAQTLKWRQQAAAAGSIIAQVNLSDQLFKGVGGPPDAAGAYRWARVAAVHSEPGSRAFRVATANAAEARTRLSPEQVNQSDAWVKAWKAGR